MINCPFVRPVCTCTAGAIHPVNLPGGRWVEFMGNMRDFYRQIHIQLDIDAGYLANLDKIETTLPRYDSFSLTSSKSQLA